MKGRTSNEPTHLPHRVDRVKPLRRPRPRTVGLAIAAVVIAVVSSLATWAVLATDGGVRLTSDEFAATITNVSPHGICISERSVDDDCAVLLTDGQEPVTKGESVLVTEVWIRGPALGEERMAFYVRPATSTP